MKKILLSILTIIILTAGYFSFYNISYNAHAFGNGSPGNRTGSPGDGGATCTGCHSGTVNSGSAQINIITTTIPSSGYVPGQTYQISTTIMDMTSPAFGFEVTAEDASNNTAGTFAANTSGASVKTILSNTSATHNGKASNTGSGQFWVYDWTAPSAGTGDVTFYTAVNAVNNNGTTSGDLVYTTSVTVQEDVSTSITEINAEKIVVFPNPASEILNFKNLNENTIVQVFDMNGKLVIEKPFYSNSGTINIYDFPKGRYIVNLSSNNTLYETSSFIKL